MKKYKLSDCLSDCDNCVTDMKKQCFFWKKSEQLAEEEKMGKHEPISSGEASLDSLELLAALSYSAAHGGIKVKIPFKHKSWKIPKAESTIPLMNVRMDKIEAQQKKKRLNENEAKKRN